VLLLLCLTAVHLVDTKIKIIRSSVLEPISLVENFFGVLALKVMSHINHAIYYFQLLQAIVKLPPDISQRSFVFKLLVY
jgi:hypothetical protein